MKTSEFKTKTKEIKDFLIGKKITIEFFHNNKVEKIECKSINHFGLNILKLEKLGAKFNFNKVSNHLVSRSIQTEKTLNKWMNRGSWTNVNVLATTVK